VNRVLKIFHDCNADEWAKGLKQQYFDKALHHLNEVAVLSVRKKPLMEIADFFDTARLLINLLFLQHRQHVLLYHHL